MVKSFPTKTRPAGRFFGSQSRRSKALRKGRTAGQSSTTGSRLLPCASISQMRQILLAPWPFRIPQRRRSRANAVNDDALPLPLRQNLNRLPEDRSRGRGRGRLHHGKAILGRPTHLWLQGLGSNRSGDCKLPLALELQENCLSAGGTRSKGRFESYARIAVAADV